MFDLITAKAQLIIEVILVVIFIGMGTTIYFQHGDIRKLEDAAARDALLVADANSKITACTENTAKLKKDSDDKADEVAKAQVTAAVLAGVNRKLGDSILASTSKGNDCEDSDRLINDYLKRIKVAK